MSTEPGSAETPSPPGAPQEASAPGPERLLALSDGVVAIALTLLVLELRVPAIALLQNHPDSASKLAGQLAHDTNQLISYVVSFYVIAQFWLTHHRVFRVVAGHSEGLAWWNFAFLFTITLIPFTSGLLGSFAENPLAVDIFAANMLLASLASQATARFIRRKNLIAAAAYNQEQARAGQIRAFSVAAIMAASIAVAWVNPDDAKYLWILISFLPDIVIRATRPKPEAASRTPHAELACGHPSGAAARYDGHSEWYDQYFGPGHRTPAEELSFLREALGAGHGQVCVELACGTGLWAQPIAAAGYRAAGLDISADQLRITTRTAAPTTDISLSSTAVAAAMVTPHRSSTRPPGSAAGCSGWAGTWPAAASRLRRRAAGHRGRWRPGPT
jgi:TMEM175 potassium channel family protein